MKVGKGTAGRALVTAVTLFSAVGASAAPLTGTFREELSFPSFMPDVRVLQRTSEPIAGSPDLTGADEIADPQDYFGEFNVDLSQTGLLTLTGVNTSGVDSYERIVVTITNLSFDFAGQAITGFTVLGGSGIIAPGLGTPAPVLGFTGNSLTVTYENITNDPSTTGFFIADGGTATFQATFSPQAIPEPATGLLLAAGLAMGLVVPRRKAALESKEPLQS